VGGDVVEFSVTDRSKLGAAVDAVAALGLAQPTADAQAGRVQVHAGDQGSDVLVEAVRSLDAAGIATTGLGVRRPSLDDVFVSLTGHGAEDDAATDGAEDGQRRRGRGREA
jgi:ABC-2 type transport system ATP-binding protein